MITNGTNLIEFPSAWRASGLEPSFINFIAMSQSKTKPKVIQTNTQCTEGLKKIEILKFALQVR